MSKQVKITANPVTGQVFTLALDAQGAPRLDKNGKEHGFIRVESKTLNLGFAYNKASKTRSALIPMLKSAFEADKAEMKAGTLTDGQIIRIDSLNPSYKGQKPLQFPKTDASGNVIPNEFNTVTSGGAPVYRSEVFSADQNASDVTLSYDRVESNVKAASSKGTVIAD